MARILAPLMDAGIISLQGRVCSAAPPLSFTGGKPTLFQDIFLDIDICLLPAALGQPVDLDAFGELLAEHPGSSTRRYYFLPINNAA